ncbi:MAG: PqqD family protein [Bacteroidales bacterium]
MKILQSCKFRDIAGDKILLVKSEGMLDLTKVVLMNSTAELLFNELKDKDFTIEHAATLLVNKYGIDPADAERDSLSWLASMKEAGLVTE